MIDPKDHVLQTWMGRVEHSGVGMGDSSGFPERKVLLLNKENLHNRHQSNDVQYFKLVPVTFAEVEKLLA